jgi:hypothetical protein
MESSSGKRIWKICVRAPASPSFQLIFTNNLSVPALSKRRSAIRAIECSRCGLSDRGIVQLLGHMERQNATMECVNISDNAGRIDLERFSASMARFSRIRKLDISRITRTSGDSPLIAAEVLQSWKLEELVMNGVPVSTFTDIMIAC